MSSTVAKRAYKKALEDFKKALRAAGAATTPAIVSPAADGVLGLFAVCYYDQTDGGISANPLVTTGTTYARIMAFVSAVEAMEGTMKALTDAIPDLRDDQATPSNLVVSKAYATCAASAAYDARAAHKLWWSLGEE